MREHYFNQGSEMPDDYDSRAVIRDKEEIVTVLRQPDQILPYCCLNIKQDRITWARSLKTQLMLANLDKKYEATKTSTGIFVVNAMKM